MLPKVKTPKDSLTIKTEIVCPNDTNPMGMLMGGRLVEWMDIAAAVCAQTHSDKICITALINEVKFEDSAKVGDIILIKAVITAAFRTSMEIKVTATTRNILSGMVYPISKAYFTFVALDDRGRATPVATLQPETEEEKRKFEQAHKKRNARVQS